MSEFWAMIGVAVPVILSTFLMPLIVKRMEAKTRAEERAEDKAELKEAAEKVQEVARQAKETAAKQAEIAESAAIEAKKLAEKVNDVHTLVNSKLTGVTMKLRDRTKALLSDKMKAKRKKPLEIKFLQDELNMLDEELADRRVQQAKVDAAQESPNRV